MLFVLSRMDRLNQSRRRIMSQSPASYAGAPWLRCFYRGGASRGQNSRWEINGTQGDLVLTAGIGIIQVADLKLEGGRDADASVGGLPIPHFYYDFAPQAPARRPRNVGYLYTQFARDLREGTHQVPVFVEATKRHALVEAIQLASGSGVRQLLAAKGSSS